jgi:hypothetical protein
MHVSVVTEDMANCTRTTRIRSLVGAEHIVELQRGRECQRQIVPGEFVIYVFDVLEECAKGEELPVVKEVSPLRVVPVMKITSFLATLWNRLLWKWKFTG